MPRSGLIVASDFRPKFDNRLDCLEAEKNQQGKGANWTGLIAARLLYCCSRKRVIERVVTVWRCHSSVLTEGFD